MMASIDQRTSFFERGAASWQRLTGTSRNVYICPICEGEFGRDAVASRELTIEHVPPESLGGQALTLTCRSCNSMAGHTVDGAAHNREQLRQLSRAILQKVGSFSGRARLEIDAIPLNVQIDVAGGELTISVPEGINDPQKFKEQIEYLRNMDNAGRAKEMILNMTPRLRFHVRHSEISDLRSAYLACFARFGYSYAMLPALDSIRHQIREPDARILENAWLLRPSGVLEENAIVRVLEPVSGVAVFVGITIVLLPWFDSPNDFYSVLRSSVCSERTMTIKGEVLGWPVGMELRLDSEILPP